MKRFSVKKIGHVIGSRNVYLDRTEAHIREETEEMIQTLHDWELTFRKINIKDLSIIFLNLFNIILLK